MADSVLHQEDLLLASEQHSFPQICAIELHFTESIELCMFWASLRKPLSNPSFQLFINNILNLGGFWGKSMANTKISTILEARINYLFLRWYFPYSIEFAIGSHGNHIQDSTMLDSLSYYKQQTWRILWISLYVSYSQIYLFFGNWKTINTLPFLEY